MKSPLRICLAAFVALMLVLTSQVMAVARGASGPAGQMVLCTGTGSAVIYVDQNGAPTGPPVYCPVCALVDLATIAPPPQFLAFELTTTSADFPALRGILRSSPRPGNTRARAPPMTV
ncbi:MAG: hypothetical protein L3J36_09575 [Rhodobacteraceae bacterium]|nr:hypothetical protein [Paracoccaceae bacterium]